MLLLAVASIALTVGLVVLLVSNAAPARSKAVKSRMVEMGLDGMFTQDAVRRRERERGRLQDLLEYLGERMEQRGHDWGRTRRRLVHAGYREARALPLYLGIRYLSVALLGLFGLFVGTAANVSGGFALVVGGLGLFTGWFLPGFFLSARVSRRQNEIQKALPDALDLLVICVEAGLGLNQALVRVANEMRFQSKVMTEELALTNSAIRAGTPRDQALMDWAERTGVADVRSLANMLVQTERFGTSIAHSLRVHAETMRSKRRQRAEEAAAKTTIKMIFPLAFCIFPSLFVVILGPAALTMITEFSRLGGS
ncbi:MAG: type II secretion system F family protein [Gemmatimonadota bacterium]